MDPRKNCGYSEKSSREEKKQENLVSVESKVADAGCSCKNENILHELGLDSDEVDGSLQVNEKNHRYSVQKELKDAGVMTEEIQERCCVKLDSVLKNAETCTDDIDDSVELTNVYINEISLCYCNDKEDTAIHIGVNTECVEESTFANIATITDCVKFRDTSTQVFFKEIHFCACDKGVKDEFVIENIKFDNREVDCKCDKETSTLDRVDSNDSPCKKSECNDSMKRKINEIVDLNEKIREKFRVLKGSKDLCSVSVQTLCKRSCSSRNIEIQVRASVTSLTSNVGISLPIPPKCQESTTQRIKVCDNSVCRFRNENSTLRRSILTEVAASLDDPTLRKLRDNLQTCEIIRESVSTSVISSKKSSSPCNFAEGDTIYLQSQSFSRHKQHNIQRTCRCSKRNNFLNFLSEHLTKESFERCKCLVRSILRKLLEKVKALNDLRKPINTCRHCCAASTYHHEPYCSEKTTCGGSRLAAGASVDYVSCRWSKEFTRANEFTRACRDFEKRGGRRPRQQLVRRETTRRRSSEWEYVSSERCRRIEAFTSGWRKPIAGND